MASSASLTSQSIDLTYSMPTMESNVHSTRDRLQVRSVPRLRRCKGRIFRASSSSLTSTTPEISISADNLQSASSSSSESFNSLPLTTSLNASLGPVMQVSDDRRAGEQDSLHGYTSSASEDSMAAFFDVDEVGRRTTFVVGDFLSDYFGSDSIAPGDDNEDSMSSGATFGELASSVARFSTPSLQDVPLDDSSSSDARSVISDSTPSSPNSQNMDEDTRSLETRSLQESTEMAYRDRYDGLFAPRLLVDPASVEPAPPIPSRLFSSPSVLCKDQGEHERPGRGGRMGRRARMRYLAPKDDGFPERPTSIDFTMGGRIKASPGMSDMAAYLFEAENFYVSGCDGNRTEAERKCADTRYLTTITDWPAGYGPHGPWYMYDTLLKKWVLEEQYDTSEEAQYRRWDNYMTLRRLLRYRMDSIEFRKWTKPSGFDSSQENDVPETGLEWVEEFVSPTPEWTVGDVSKKARKAKKDKKKKLPKGCPAFWLDVDEAEMVSDHQAVVDLPNQDNILGSKKLRSIKTKTRSVIRKVSAFFGRRHLKL